MIILAIESSCDDTCVAILKDKELLSNVVSSQTEFHNKYGGVMPELASRLHVEKITYVIKEAVSKANITLQDVDYIAFTVGPGLVGSLHVGMQAAKTLALLLNKPLVPVHHNAADGKGNEAYQQQCGNNTCNFFHHTQYLIVKEWSSLRERK